MVGSVYSSRAISPSVLISISCKITCPSIQAFIPPCNSLYSAKVFAEFLLRMEDNF